MNNYRFLNTIVFDLSGLPYSFTGRNDLFIVSNNVFPDDFRIKKINNKISAIFQTLPYSIITFSFSSSVEKYPKLVKRFITRS